MWCTDVVLDGLGSSALRTLKMYFSRIYSLLTLVNISSMGLEQETPFPPRSGVIPRGIVVNVLSGKIYCINCRPFHLKGPHLEEIKMWRAVFLSDSRALMKALQSLKR